MTTHNIVQGNSNNLSMLNDNSVHLIITSPPYPMISMWDNMFSEWDMNIKEYINNNNSINMFNHMHNCLNTVWKECDRVLINGGFICINIGDATRTVNNNFQLYSNHSKIIEYFSALGYSVLPDIIWRKPNNSPNKFMGSGMYPCGAYVTYEHEYILIFRKGDKRVFTDDESERRKQSAYFYEERNIWFSDLWNIQGASQFIKMSKHTTRHRNASYPFEIPYRLINMYSIQGDTVLDPFCGLGTTNLAALVANRNSIGIDLDNNIIRIAKSNLLNSTISANSIVTNRLNTHREYTKNNQLKYWNDNHKFNVKTKQEQDIFMHKPIYINKQNNLIICNYDYDK